MDRLLALLSDLKAANIHFTLEYNRDDSIMVLVAVPGERWEVEFFTDGHVETEVFQSDGVTGEEQLERLFRDFSD